MLRLRGLSQRTRKQSSRRTLLRSLGASSLEEALRTRSLALGTRVTAASNGAAHATTFSQGHARRIHAVGEQLVGEATRAAAQVAQVTLQWLKVHARLQQRIIVRGKGRGLGKGPSPQEPCFKCGSTQHWAMNCPKGGGSGKGRSHFTDGLLVVGLIGLIAGSLLLICASVPIRDRFA